MSAVGIASPRFTVVRALIYRLLIWAHHNSRVSVRIPVYIDVYKLKRVRIFEGFPDPREDLPNTDDRRNLNHAVCEVGNLCENHVVNNFDFRSENSKQ